MVGIIFIFVFLNMAFSQEALERDKMAINIAKQTRVREIDNSLPDMPYEEWLLELAGAKTRVSWEVNDCGEQTGDLSIDHARDIPMCVESLVAFEGNTKLHVVLHVGFFNKGITAKSAYFFYAVIIKPDGHQDWSIKKLSQLPNAIKTIKAIDVS